MTLDSPLTHLTSREPPLQWNRQEATETVAWVITFKIS